MKITNLSVKNFRTLENISVNFIGFYTAISGQNNSGKTTLVKVLRSLFRDNTRDFYIANRNQTLRYDDDKTQWIDGNPDILFQYTCSVSKFEDHGLYMFISKFTEKDLVNDNIELKLVLSFKKDASMDCKSWVNNNELSNFSSKELYQKLTSSNLAFMHDSAATASPIFTSRGRFLHELSFSEEELEKIADEQKRMQRCIKNISKVHRSELTDLLGHLEEKYEVEFSIPDGIFSGNLPLEINLKDKNVDVPLNDWGSGTKNRTQIMMSILQANRIKCTSDESKITPFVIIEEPESFLHPSAQAEFGRVLSDLANKLQIQTIVTTHSPYMLCQENINSNILLERKQVRGRLKQTEIRNVEKESWMEPFSEILGLDNAQFVAWKEVLTSKRQSVLLVEGELDKCYYQHIKTLKIPGFDLPEGLEIVPYEGKDALKNTILLKFILDKFKNVFITFDLDAKVELEKSMQQLGLQEGVHYLPIGRTDPGKECIEGLVPDRVLSKVYSNNIDLVMQLTSADNKQRKSAKNSLKKKLLEEFKSDKAINSEDLKPFSLLFKSLNKMLK